MASYYGTLQWYQSRRTSAAHRKTGKEIEMETTGSDFLQPCRYDKSPENFDEKLCLALKRIDELIERNKKSSQKMIAEGFNPGNPVSTDPKKIGCEEASIEEPSLSANEEESHQFVDKTKTPYNQVSFQFSNSVLHKKHKVYSSDELNEKRDRGICLLCDEFMYLEHKCFKKKKFYVYEIDVDDAFEVSECNDIESPLNEEFVEMKATDFDENLIGHSIQTDSVLMKELISENENENEREEMSEIRDKCHETENEECQVFDELLNNDLPQNVAEKYMSFIKCFGDEKMNTLDATVEGLVLSTTSDSLWSSDSGCRKSMAIVIANQPPKGIGSLFILVSMLEIINQSWVELPELSLPPPELPPRMI